MNGFGVNVGLRHGCVMSPWMFHVLLLLLLLLKEVGNARLGESD